MLISEYLAARNSISVSTGTAESQNLNRQAETADNGGFAEALRDKLQGRQVEFSGHAIRRLESRQIDVSENDKMERLNRGVELAAEKGSEESLILVDSTAFVVSVKNNRVITTVSADDLKGNVFTNIDSTVII
ncbi:MAG: TIGR02530 family flagellar biosynthesis protein [Ruminiclostridium sp.]